MLIFRKLIVFAGVFFFLCIMIAVVLIYVIDVDAYKPSLQQTASETLGMDVVVGGRMNLTFSPGLSLTMHDVQVHNHGKELVTIGKIRLGIEALSLFQDELNITGISLQRPRITIERGMDGKYNFDRADASTTAVLPAISLKKVTISDGEFIYADKVSGERFAADDCDLKLHDIQVVAGKSDIKQALSFMARLHCGRVGTKGYQASDMQLEANARNGVFKLDPITLKIFGGTGSGSVQADYSAANPILHMHFGLPQFRIERLLETQSSEVVLSGPMSLSMNLVAQGRGIQQMKRSVSGDVLLQGNSIRFQGYDLDAELDRYESSQNFSLLDMGAIVVAGPAGIALTKGRDFANVLRGGGGSSNIRTFVSRWRVKRGVMHAQDVAMATRKYRMAMLGGLDIANERFVGVTLALLTHAGCAEVQQKISGPFAKPVVAQPNIIKSVAGPVLKLLETGRKLLPGGRCKVIYTGSVAAPR